MASRLRDAISQAGTGWFLGKTNRLPRMVHALLSHDVGLILSIERGGVVTPVVLWNSISGRS